MASAAEGASASQGIAAALDEGLDTLAGSSSPIVFTLYNRKVLPLDGYVFWIMSGLQTDPVTAPTTLSRKGSLHLQVSKVQEETESYGLTRCIFTSEEPISEDFLVLGTNNIYIANYPTLIGGNLQFAFSNVHHYRQAGIWHYVGDAVYPFMSSQVINSAEDIPTNALVVSNSLPFWLSLNDYAPFYGFGNTIPLYPSHLVTANTVPPFGSVHIVPESTQAVASVPWLGRKSTHNQLTRETVNVSLYGLTNDQALTFQDCVLQYMTDFQFLGLANAPTMRDHKRDQNELSVIAMKKSIEFEVNYFQNSIRNIARQLIESAVPSVRTVWPTAWPLPDPYAQPTYTG